MIDKTELEHFNKAKIKNQKFWLRLGGAPSFKGLRVLDIGCGSGNLCVDIASRGASQVLGIDINDRLINFAKENILHNYPHLKNILDFQCLPIADLAETEFDIMVSKDSFEHILDLDLALAAMRKRLAPGGKMYIGFGPLYRSPYGDHNRTKALLPWGHLIFPESFLLKRLNKHRPEKISSIYELGLNKLSLTEYKKLFFNSGLKVTYFRANVSKNPIMKLFSLIGAVSFLEEYFSYNLYCILEKPG